METHLNQLESTEKPVLHLKLSEGKGALNSIRVDDKKWLSFNYNIFIEGSSCFADNPYFGRQFGCAYPYDLLITSLPLQTKVPSSNDWELLLKSVGNNVSELGLKGYSGMDLKPIGFHISTNRIVTNHSVIYWTSTTKGKNQIAVHFDLLYNSFDFITIPRNWAVAARLIIQ